MDMTIALKFVDLSKESAGLIFDWLKETASDKSSENLSPLRYVQSITVLEAKGGEG